MNSRVTIILVIMAIYLAGMLWIGLKGRKYSETNKDFMNSCQAGKHAAGCRFVPWLASGQWCRSRKVHSMVHFMVLEGYGMAQAQRYPLCYLHWSCLKLCTKKGYLTAA